MGSQVGISVCECVLFVEDEYYFAGNCGEECERTSLQCGGEKVWNEDVSSGEIGLEDCYGV